jgi:formamidopyrimidine-DNA glycosylase
VPELPDVVVYLEALQTRIQDQPIEKIRFASPFVLRSVDPPASDLIGRHVRGFRRLGKRLVFVLDDDYFIVIHLMIAGRLRWKPRGAGIPGKLGLAAFDFPNGSLLLTEASGKKRASIHFVRGAAALNEHDRRGLEPLEISLAQFREALTRESHTVKRTLTDPRTFSGIGNAYSDEILHAAKLSPLALTSKLDDDSVERLYHATQATLKAWVERLRAEAREAFPEKVTAFREGMAVHGRYKKPCPVCGSPIQRIRYADNEVNYCAECQTGGRVLADRSLSRLLKKDWPRSIDEWEAEVGGQAAGRPGGRRTR